MKINDKDKYKLPKSRVVGPVIAYTLVFLIILGTIYAVVSILEDYVFNVRSESDMAEIKALGILYDTGSEKQREEILDRLTEQGRAYLVADKDGRILRSNGKITCEGYDPSEDQISDAAMMEFFEETTEIDAETNENLIRIGIDVKANNTFRLDDSEQRISSFGFLVRLGLDNADTLVDENATQMMVPYWIATGLVNSSQVLIVRSELPINGKDYLYLIAGVVLSIILAVFLFAIMIIGVIRNLHANRKMKKIMFRDNIAPGRNWLWYVVHGREILLKRRNAAKTYAIVELVFIKYRNYVLCHSVKEAEELLRKVAEVITSKLGKGELCAHSTSSGLPLLLEVKGENDARERLEDMIRSLEEIPSPHKLSFRAGVYLVTPSKEDKFDADIDLLYNNACAAGLSIADNPDSGIAFFDDKLVEQEKWIDTISERQQGAIDNEEFLVYYQPKYDPRTDELMGAEALVRWNTSDMGLIPPYRFIPVFENNGFITKIDHYMVSHVARDQKKWLDEGRKCVPVSVNISRAHFSEDDLADQICSLVDKEGAPHELIEIELTESAFFDDKNAMLNTINKLKSHGFLISMDDFGSGYSSLNSLKDMPLDILKLDAGFFRGENTDQSRTEIVVSEAIRLAKSLNMKTVAEGVEDKAQVDFLASEGCDMIQGYYYAKPMPKEEFEQRIGAVSEIDETAPQV